MAPSHENVNTLWCIKNDSYSRLLHKRWSHFWL